MSDFIEKQIGYQIKAISEGLNDSARQCLNMLEKIENCQQSYKEVLKAFYCAQRITIPGQPVSDSNTEISEADLLEFEEFQQLEQLKQKLQEQIDLYQRQICFLNQISEKDVRKGKIFLSRTSQLYCQPNFLYRYLQELRDFAYEAGSLQSEVKSLALQIFYKLPDEESMRTQMEQYSEKVDRLLKVYEECEKDVQFILNEYTVSGALPTDLADALEEVCDFSPKGSDDDFGCAMDDLGSDDDFTKTDSSESVAVSDVEVSAVAPKQMQVGEYSIVTVTLYAEQYRKIVDDMIAQSSDPVQEKHGSPMQAQDHAKITVSLSADGVDIEEEQQIQYWNQKYLIFDFPVILKSDWKKTTVLFKGVISINDVPASKISFLVKCRDYKVQQPEIKRRDIHSAFVSYSRRDISQVAFVMMGIRKARPDLEMFFDVESMHSGEDWEKRIKREIDEKDILFLCWSVHASKSAWVDREWRYAYERKGADGIDPIPLESAQKCPPPKELEKKHFNENLLFIVESNRESHVFGKNGQITVLECKTMELHSWSQRTIIIGREGQKRCDLNLDSRNVSRQHLLLKAKDRDGMYTVKDLDSTGHTYLVSEKWEQILEPEREYKVPVGTVLRLANCYIIVL